MSTAPTPIEVFCSYAHEDEPLLKQLETHLSLLKRQGLISLWHDRQIVPGMDWAQTIDVHVERASLILLLETPQWKTLLPLALAVWCFARFYYFSILHNDYRFSDLRYQWQIMSDKEHRQSCLFEFDEKFYHRSLY